jgi:hypothetical protein
MRTLRFALALGALTIAPSLSRSQSAPAAKPDTGKVDVTGKWSFNIEMFNATPTVTFTQKGDSISGQYISATLGTKDFKGTVKGRAITFSFPAESGGQSFVMAFSGKIDDADTMSGSIDFSGMAQSGFSGKRAKP